MNDHNPYSTPNASLVKNNIPKGYPDASLKPEQFRGAGWIAWVYLLLNIPYTYYSMNPDNLSLVSFSLLGILITVIFVYLMLVLLKFVKARFELTGLESYAYSIISLSIILTVLGTVAPPTTGENLTNVDMFFIAIVPIYGIILVLLGLKLKKTNEDYKYMQAFAKTTIVMGGLLATVVLAVVGLVAGVVWSVLLALLFFEAAREMEVLRNSAPQGEG
ncbi:MAG: hypothetical protein ACFCBW_09685 [Candidatus Competibacterales bacterium]